MNTTSWYLLLCLMSIAQAGPRYASRQDRPYNGAYEGAHLDRIAFPLGGMGAGMVCLEGSGCLSHVSVRHEPDIFKEPKIYAAVSLKTPDMPARVLEAPVPGFKVLQSRGGAWNSSGNGAGGTTFGLPRFKQGRYQTRFPFATLTLSDPGLPLRVELTGWSPFTPPDADDSSLPVAGLEYRLINTSDRALEGVFSFHAENFMAVAGKPGASVEATPGGFMLRQSGVENEPWHEGTFCVVCDDPRTQVDCAWFRGGWFDSATMVWQAVSSGAMIQRPPHAQGDAGAGGSLYVPFALGAGASRTVRLRLAWYVPQSQLRHGERPPQTDAPGAASPACCPEGSCATGPPAPQHYVPWYAARFPDAEALLEYWRKNYAHLRRASGAFRDCFYDSTLPPEVIEAVAANLAILKSPTCLRQHDGSFWGWEGCRDTDGCCSGSCTHVWNYAQALPHLFPAMERSMREATLLSCQDTRGHQTFRTPLPIGPASHGFHAAADGQLGHVMRVYREWRVSGDTGWLVNRWPLVRQSLDYCIEAWDPTHTGTLREPHHNTYDIEFWGPDGMCTSMYLGALRAAILMGAQAGDEVSLYRALALKSKTALERDLYDGEYFIQKIQTQGLKAQDPTSVKSIHLSYSPEALALLQQEGPKYQYGSGCLSDGVLGAWIAEMCGLDPILDAEKVRSHLLAVYRYNFRADLSTHANPQRPTYALNDEGGLLLCSWPKGHALSLPFVYSNEVWTGIEYQVASHLMRVGQVAEALDIVRACRDRYDGRVRNPFSEIECGHFYARALASYGLLQGMTGVRYDAVDKTLTAAPRMDGEFRTFLCTATGFGTVVQRQGKVSVDVKQGAIDIRAVKYVAF